MKSPTQNVNTHKRSKKDWAALIIIACLILLAASIILGPTQSRQMFELQDDHYAERLEAISNNYQRCIERADSGLPSATSRVSDPMEGTAYSKERLAAGDRDDCMRTYRTQMRVLKSSY